LSGARTTHAGLEALVGASFALAGSDRHRIEPLVSLTVNAFSFDSDPVYGNNDLPAAPAYAARGEVMYRNAGGLYAGPTFDLVGRRYADFANTYRVDSYGLLGLRGGYARKTWELFGEVRNLLDENYIATLSVLNVASPDARVLYPGAPVSAYVACEWSSDAMEAVGHSHSLRVVSSDDSIRRTQSTFCAPSYLPHTVSGSVVAASARICWQTSLSLSALIRPSLALQGPT
jgi:hypothetical protein